MQMPPRRPRAIWSLVALVAGAALGVDLLLVVPQADTATSPTWWCFGFLTGAFFLAQAAGVKVRVGAHAIGFSLMEFPLVIGLYFCSPQLLVFSSVLGTAAVFAWRRPPLLKTLFNCALFALETAGAVAIWHAVLDDEKPFSPQGWLATGLALLYTSVLGAVLVHVAIGMASHRPRLRESFGPQKIGEFASASFGLVAVYVMSRDLRAIWMLVVVAAVLWVAHRSYDQARLRAESLEKVSRFTDAVAHEVELEAVVGQVLHGVRDAFQARCAELSLVDDSDVVADWVLAADADAVARRPAALLGSLSDTIIDATLLGTGHPGAQELAHLGFRVGLFVPLRAEGRVIGSLVVADPIGDSAVFGNDDLRQLQALANHAAVAIDNALRADLILRQAAEREHAALHDDLTSLPNRRLFGRKADEVLATRRAAVLLVDIDNLRAVNDALGHQVGDRLVEMVARRIRDAVPDDAVVGRLGGDEFGVLLPGADDQAARDCASMVRCVLTVTFDLDGLPVAVDTSVGVVVAQPGTEAATVLRHADLALYAAQESRSGTAVFHPGLERTDSSRLGLLADLRSAVAEHALCVHYQPQIELRTGRVVGVEALARWTHPTLGEVQPDEFVPLAEHSGLITPLTMLVLRDALRAAERIQGRPGAFRIAVNISPRSLLDPGFVDEVGRELAGVTVPASALTLEITETSLMTDPEQAVEALDRLRSLGVRLSVDDLGTGYSSLAYLLKLPVDELKIDRSFVATLPDPAAETVLGAIIDLGHRLGRDVVAEGIEHAAAYDVLRTLDCDLAQGYWMGRPMPLIELESYLADRRPTRVGELRG